MIEWADGCIDNCTRVCFRMDCFRGGACTTTCSMGHHHRREQVEALKNEIQKLETDYKKQVGSHALLVCHPLTLTFHNFLLLLHSLCVNCDCNLFVVTPHHRYSFCFNSLSLLPSLFCFNSLSLLPSLL